MKLNEDYIQETTAAHLEQELGWRSVFAWHKEDFGQESLLGRYSEQEVVLKQILREKLKELNPGLPPEAYTYALDRVAETSATQQLVAINQQKYEMIRNGVLVSFHNTEGEQESRRLRLIDFDDPEKNDFLCVREFVVKGDLYRRRADIVGFVNGIPLLFMELKYASKDIQAAYEENLSDYKDTVAHLFHHNAIVVLANGIDAKLGSVTSQYEHFHEWKRLAEGEKGAVNMQTLLNGVCNKANFLDLVENFIVFDDSAGETRKILARNHQFLGVNKAVEAVRDRKRRKGRLGVFWHTQGAGKSYSMVMFTRKVHRKLGGNYTFLVLTDREDLDAQIYKTFAGCDVVLEGEECRASSGSHLQKLLQQHKTHIFSLIQKFHREVDQEQGYTERDDVIVISDEAHRTQYGLLARNMRDALPNASYIGFTGTPLLKADQLTRQVFGDYVSKYDFHTAVEDGATVPLFFLPRGEQLGISTNDLNEQLAEKLEELEKDGDVNVSQRLEQEFRRGYFIITAEKRLEQIARDFVEHYSKTWEAGKAMLVCIDKTTCVRMHELIEKYWKERIEFLEKDLKNAEDDQNEQYRKRQIVWMKEAIAAVVVSEEQGEVEKFREAGLNILPHRKLIKQGIELPQAMRQLSQYQSMQRMELDAAFKDDRHPFRIAIVCAMWLTGFDVPCLANMYLDKPLKAHNLMQTIARANRTHKGKVNGLIIDYCGILKNLRDALAEFATGETGGDPPLPPEAVLLAQLGNAIGQVKSYLREKGAPFDEIGYATGFELFAAIEKVKEAVNENDITRKKFELRCRLVFRLFRACISFRGVNAYRADHKIIETIYERLQDDVEKVDISELLKGLRALVDERVDPKEPDEDAEELVFDLSKIDHEKLAKKLGKLPGKKTYVQRYKVMVQQRLKRMLEQNPARSDLQKAFEEIVAAYNQEKDRPLIEETLRQLIALNEKMNDEEKRAVREGLDEESLAVFDILEKPALSETDKQRVKDVVVGLLQDLKEKLAEMHQWREKDATKADVKQFIHDTLFADGGLPEPTYSDAEIEICAEDVYRHVHRVYPTLPSPVYGEGAAVEQRVG